MGVLNATPDSFSDGGQFNKIEDALKQIDKLQKDGADIIDIGGESTGPNSKDITLEEELNRVIPIIVAARKITDLPISIDTNKAAVADQAIKAGATMINDVTALRNDPKMASVAATHNCPIILMYSKDNTPRTTIEAKEYDNIIQTLEDFFTETIKTAKSAGIKSENIIIDPGMGQFISSIPRYSFEIIARLNELKKRSRQIAIGISRKSFLGGPIQTRDETGKTASAIAYLNGASIIRTHDVGGLKQFLINLNN